MEPDHPTKVQRHKLGVVDGVYIPVCLNILSILMFLRFGTILGQIGLLGMLGLLAASYLVDLVTTLSLSAVASNGEVKGGGAYYLISRSLGPEFGGSIGLLFYLSQVLNTALNVVGLVDCLRLNFGSAMPQGYWAGYLVETAALVVCTLLCLAGSGTFAKASNALLVVLTLSIVSIPLSALFVRPFSDPAAGVEFTGVSLATLRSNLLPPRGGGGGRAMFRGLATFRDLFGILFPATSGIFAGASMSGDLRNPSKAIPAGTLWAMASTLAAYLLVMLSLAASTTPASLLRDPNIIQTTSAWSPIVFAGECATTFFSALMGVIGSAKLMQALARDRLVPGLSALGAGTRAGDEPLAAIALTYVFAQLSLFANLNQIATLISMGYQMTFFVMNLACFLLKIGSAPNFRPAFKWFSWHTALAGSVASAAAMFFVDETYASSAVCLLVFLFLLIHYLSPPKHWGDVSQNLIYHQVRKYLLRLKPEHIKFWRPQIILLVGDPRRQTRLIQFCNSVKKGSLYILGHVIVTDDFSSGVQEAKLQQSAWTRYISEYSRIKAFVQLNMSPTITWGVRNLILSAGLGGMRPNIAVLGFYNMDDLRRSRPFVQVPEIPPPPPPPPPGTSPEAGEAASTVLSTAKATTASSTAKATTASSSAGGHGNGKARQRRRGDPAARLLDGELPTDIIKPEEMMSVTSYLTILEDLALRHRINVAVGKGFGKLETPRKDGKNPKRFIDLWPIQMSAEVRVAHGKSVVTTNFDTYTLILQLGYILSTVPAWSRVFKLRVMVFVEYEEDVEEERQRVAALLTKLRIDAQVHTCCLSSGDLTTYEAVVHGVFRDPLVETAVKETLRGEWWDEVQRMREAAAAAAAASASGSAGARQGGRDGRLNHDNGDDDDDDDDGDDEEDEVRHRRRSSVSLLAELSKNPTVSVLARMGFSMGIHAQSLPRNVYDHGSDDESDGSETSSDAGAAAADFNDDVESAASEADLLEFLPPRRSFLDNAARRKSHGDAIMQKPAARRSHVWFSLPTEQDAPSSAQPPPPPPPPPRPASAPLIAEPSGIDSWRDGLGEQAPSLPRQGAKSPASVRSPSPKKSPRKSTTSPLPDKLADESAAAPKRPILGRAHSAFARTLQNPGSHDPPDSESAISDTLSPTVSRPPRPGFSRTSSTSRFSSSLVPQTRITDGGGPADSGPSISFAEPESEPSWQSSVDAAGGPEDLTDSVQINIPELLVATYRSPLEPAARGGDVVGDGRDYLGKPPGTARDGGGDRDGREEGSRPPHTPAASTFYSAQGWRRRNLRHPSRPRPFSFNDLPCRAQHLILNELMRRNSGETGVLFTTLPIPEEGTCESEEASLQYLSDVEVLCHELPPTLMVLSNNMTVTVSL